MTLHTGTIGPIIRAVNTEPEVVRQFVQSELQSLPGVVGTGDLAVSQNGTPNMTVNVSSGFAFVLGSNSSPQQGMYHAYNDAAVNLAIAAADPTNPRYDVVCLTLQDAFYSGANNQPLLQVITGTPNAVPIIPSVPASSLSLATVAVAARATSIVSANITDSRTFCGATIAPRGIMQGGVAQATANQTIGTTPTTISTLGVTLTVPAARRIRIKVNAIMQCGSTSATTGYLTIVDGSTQLAQGERYFPAASAVDTMTVEWVGYLSAGPHTIIVQSRFDANTNNQLIANASAPAQITVEDIGIF